MTTIPHYTDDLVTLHHADCRDVLPHLAPGTVDVLLTDPPYYRVKNEEWDRQWRTGEEFLGWLSGILDLCLPLLTASASVWVFTSPEMCDDVKRVVGSRWRVLNSIRWIKDEGWHKKAEVEAQRRYLTPWEGIVFGEQRCDTIAGQAHDRYTRALDGLHKRVYSPIGRYIAEERERAGLTRSQVEVALGYISRSDPTRGTALCYRWEEGSSLPTPEAYARLRDLLGPGYLRREYEDLRREYEDLRRPFRLTKNSPTTDLWTFPPVEHYPGKHPCEKPPSLLRHILTTSTRGPGDLVLDPFAGSCSTLRVCKELGLRGIGIEKELRYCVRAADRLAQDVMVFPEAS